MSSSARSGPGGDRIDFVRLLPVLRRQLAEAERRAQRALAEVDGLRKIVAGAEQMAEPSRSQPALFVDNGREQAEAEDQPRGQEAVRRVLETQPSKVWSLSEITQEILRRGWIDPEAKVPPAAIRAATQRLASTGMAVKVGPGRYRYRGRDPAEVNEQT